MTNTTEILYINEKGDWACHHCGTSALLFTHVPHFSDCPLVTRQKYLCPSCGLDITNNKFEQDPSMVSGFIDIGYDCPSCNISIFTFKAEKTPDYDDEPDADIPF